MRPFLLAVFSGILLAFSLPPHDWEWLAWVALVPLWFGAQKLRRLEAAGMGLVAAFACGAVLVPWTPRAYGMQYATAPFLLLSLMLGAMAQLPTLTYGRWRGLPWCLLLAACGMVVEWITTFAPMPIHLALTQHAALPLIRIASVTGIWGVSFLIWLSNAAVTEALLTRRIASPALGVTVAGVGLAIVIPALAPTPLSSGIVRAAVVQDYAGEEATAYARPGEKTVDAGDKGELTRRAAADGARLIVWPELCLGNAFNPESPDDETVRLARELGTHLVVGYSEKRQPKGYNCAALVSPQGKVLGVHRKNYPFLGERKDTQPGRLAQTFHTDVGRLGMAICFDTCYPELSRRLVRHGARLIAMPNYDPVTPRGLVHRLHGAVLPFRAVENGVPILRSDTNGTSQIIDATGRVQAEAPLFRPTYVVGDVRLGTGAGTFFTYAGDWVVYACMGLAVLLFAAGFRRSGKALAGAEAPDAEHGDLQAPDGEQHGKA